MYSDYNLADQVPCLTLKSLGGNAGRVGRRPMLYKIPLVVEPQLEGGYTVTSLLFPELVTDGDSSDKALLSVKDALITVIETYQDLGRPLPCNAQIVDANSPVWLEIVISAP